MNVAVKSAENKGIQPEDTDENPEKPKLGAGYKSQKAKVKSKVVPVLN
jgi:hypothetical protein